MKTDPKEKKEDTDIKEENKQQERPEYDDTVDYKNDDEADIDKEEYFEK